jgi:hypothetical protein
LSFKNDVYAQKKGYEKGYLISLEKDTLQGWVQDRDNGTFEDLYERIRFIPEGKRWKKKYGPNDIIGYGYGSNVFEAVPLKEEMLLFVNMYYTKGNYTKVFLKRIQQNAHLTHYEKEFVFEDNDVITSFSLFHKTNADQMVRVTQGILGLKKKRLKEYFHNCPNLLSAIDSRGLTTVQEVYDYYSKQYQWIVE